MTNYRQIVPFDNDCLIAVVGSWATKKSNSTRMSPLRYAMQKGHVGEEYSSKEESEWIL